MKKICYFVVTFAIITVSVVFCSPTVYAYNTYGGSKMIGGVGSSGNYTRYYWCDATTLSTTWQNRVVSAMTAWCNTGSQGCGVYTSVWFNRTYVKSGSVIDIYSANLSSGYYGYTEFYKGSGPSSIRIYPSSSNPQNWVWAKIKIDTTDADYDMSNTTRKKTLIEHEIGHAFGLDHILNTARLMYPDPFSWTATQPTADELYGGYNP